MSTSTPHQAPAEGDAARGAASPDLPDRVAGDLVAAGLVHPARATEAGAVVRRTLGGPAGPAARPGGRTQLIEIVGYVGGALVLAAFALFLGEVFVDLSEVGQVVVLAIIAAAFAVAGLAVGLVAGGLRSLRAGRDDVRRRLASALLSGAAIAAGLTVARAVEISRSEFDEWPPLAGALVALVVAALAYRLVAASAVGLLVTTGAGLTALGSGLALLGDESSTVVPLAVAYVLFGVLWAMLTEAGVFREPVVGRMLAAGIALFGAQLPVFEMERAWIGYALTAAVAVAGFVLYLRTVSWPYLAVGVLGVTVVVPEAITDWTDGSLGTAGGVLVAGLTLLGASLAGLRARKEAR